MKKKFISILLTGCMLTGMLAGCGSTTANGTAGAATGSTAEASSSASASQTAEAAADDKDMTETEFTDTSITQWILFYYVHKVVKYIPCNIDWGKVFEFQPEDDNVNE